MQNLSIDHLHLEPLTVAHAEGMFAVLNAPHLHDFLDHAPPPTLAHLQQVYTSLETRRSPDGSEQWLNWILRPDGEAPIGFVQATVKPDGSAWVAYLLSPQHQGHGHAVRATHLMMGHLAYAYDVDTFRATVEVANAPSVRLLERLGFAAAGADDMATADLTATERLYVRRTGQVH